MTRRSSGTRTAQRRTASRTTRRRATLAASVALTAALLLGGCRTGTVTRVVDGDTVDVDARRVRVVGIDTPERGQCGYQAAKDRMATLTAGTSVSVVPAGTQRSDRYGRELGYLHARGRDVGATLIAEGLATARYDSLDGYPPHPRQADYRRLDAASPSVCK